MTKYTQEQIALARKVAAECVIRLDGESQRGYNYASQILDGDCDNESLAVQSALAAIAATEAHVTERAARLEEAAQHMVDAWECGNQDDLECAEANLRAALSNSPLTYETIREVDLRNKEHLREPGHEQ